MCTRNPDDNTVTNATTGDPDTTNTTAATRESKIAQFLVEMGIPPPPPGELPRPGGAEEDCWTSDCFCVATLVLGMRCSVYNKPHYPHCTSGEAGVVKSTVVVVREQQPDHKTTTADEPNNPSPSTSGSTNTCSNSTTAVSTGSSKGEHRREKQPAKNGGKERGGGGTERKLPVGHPGYNSG